MLSQPTEEQIRSLHAEFISIKKYRERILFFDEHFGLINYSFPEFDPELNKLLKQEGINDLLALFERERRNSFAPEKQFIFDGVRWVFSVVPLNSYPEILIDYIISRFLGSDAAFHKTIKKIKHYAASDQHILQRWNTEASENMRFIAGKLDSKIETSLRNQFMTVFYHGYLDFINNSFKKFARRKKLIELYLYSQGILYGKYMEALKYYIVPGELEYANEQWSTPALDPISRIKLFRELGILDLLLKKYKKSEKKETERKVAQVLCLILGENQEMTDQIIPYLRAIK